LVGAGRIHVSNDTAERAPRGIAIGGKAELLAGPDNGAERTAAIHSSTITAKVSDVDPRGWIAVVLTRTNDHPPALELEGRSIQSAG
jgi:hypothetical protein